MKKLIFMRLGIGIFDERWYKSRLLLFEIITLASLENLENIEELYCFILVDSDMPLSAKRRLNEIIRASKISNKIYIRPIDYMDELQKECQKINSEFCNDDEFVIMGRLDADDALAKSIFFEMENFLNIHKNESALITFPNVYYFYLYERKFFKKEKYNFLGINTFWIVNDRKYTPYDVGHVKQGKLADKRGMGVYALYGYNCVRTCFADSTYFHQRKSEVFKNQLDDFIDKQGNNNEDYLDILHMEFGINKLDNYYKVYPEEPSFGFALPSSKKYYDISSTIKQSLKQIKEEFIKDRN